ncbi:MAG TPA: hydrogenase maturation protease [Chthoniobacterales bacterium]|nr:hydrogenase maturation protease [Chthoniobacterales bacterium]
MKKILIAGIGNIFFGDDAFGCEVAQQLMREQLPEGVCVFDYGIRSYDLAYALLEPNDAAILIDAVPRGEEPGTVFLLELDINKLDNSGNESVNAHAMNPVAVLQLVRSFGGSPGELYLVGCEPAVLETEELGLSEKVQSAIPLALDMIRELLGKFLHETEHTQKDSTGLETRTREPGSR